MDELIEQLQRISTGIVGRLNNVTSEELEAFVEERQKLVDAIGLEVENCQPTPAQKEEIRRIMEYDTSIVSRMNAHRLEAQDWLQKRNQAKAQRNAYESRYSPDSILMDRKK